MSDTTLLLFHLSLTSTLVKSREQNLGRPHLGLESGRSNAESALLAPGTTRDVLRIPGDLVAQTLRKRPSWASVILPECDS
jgi:hypothetical protein